MKAYERESNTLLLNAALSYAKLGWPVFPCKGKVPITPNGFKAATTDHSQIKKWWERHPDASIAVATGDVSGIFVLDVDVKNEAGGSESLFELEREFGELPHTVESITWSGGKHIFFRYPEKGVGCKTGIRPGIDVRGDGGYVIAPPSVIGGKRYEWEIEHHPDETMIAEAPGWLLNLLDGPFGGAASEPYDNTIPSGQRNCKLTSIGGGMRRIGLTKAEIFAALEQTNRDRCKPPLPTREVERIATSVARYEPDVVAVAEIDNHYGHESKRYGSPVADPFGLPAPIAVWLDTEPPPVDYLFENILIKGIIGGLFAQGGTGKTYLIVCLMLSAALGKQSFRTFRPTRSMRVLGLLGEDPQDMIHRRVRSILCGFDEIDKTVLADNLRLYCNRPAPLMKLDSNNPIRTEALEWLKVEVETFRPELIVIDPKSMFYGMDENSNDNNTQWINALKELTFNGATVLYCHHVTKAMSSALELNGARGGSALVDGSRFAANMRQLTEDDAKRYNIDEPWRYVEFKVTKNSYVPKLPGSIFFRFTHDGALEEVNLQATLESVMIDELLCSLQAEASEGNFYSAREVARSKTLLPDTTRKDRERIVRLAIESKVLSTEKRRTGKTDKAVLVPNEGAMANNGQNELDTFNDQENQ